MTGVEPTPGPVGRGRRARAEVADTMIVEDWSWSTIPPPVLAVEGVERGEPHVPLVMAGDGDDDGTRQVRRLTAAQARDLAAALDARADVIDPHGERREASGQAAAVWAHQNRVSQDAPDMSVPAVLDRLAAWTDALREAALFERVDGPTISYDVATLLAVHPRVAATADDHTPADPFDDTGRVTFGSIAAARDYAVAHGVTPSLTHRVPTADLGALLDEFLAVTSTPPPTRRAGIEARSPVQGRAVRADHPHRDTILTILECAGWQPPSSLRSRLVVCAERLNASDCRGTDGVRFHVGDVVQWAADGQRYLVADTPPGEEPAGRLGQVWARRAHADDLAGAAVRLDVADLTLVAYAGLGDDPPQPVEPSTAERAVLEWGQRFGAAPGDLSDAVVSVMAALDELDARHEADDDSGSMTVDDVGDVCRAVGLVRDGDEWRDEHVAVRAVTVSCMPLQLGDDDRPMYGIHVSDTAPRGAFRCDQLSEHVSPGVLAAVIGDVRRTERLRRAAEEDA